MTHLTKAERLYLTTSEATAILNAAGNSVHDPDWWESYGKGEAGAFRRACEKIERQAEYRRDKP